MQGILCPLSAGMDEHRVLLMAEELGWERSSQCPGAEDRQHPSMILGFR